MSLRNFVTLGRSGLHVSPLCLGAMTFGTEWGFGAGPEESTAVLRAYIEQGGNFIDTANFYNRGHSEKIIGDYIAANRAQRDSLVIATKFSGNLVAGSPNGGGASRKAMMAQCDNSLRRLQTEYIDLYWLHWWDTSTPIEETMRGLDDLVTAGKVRYVGFSDTPAWKVAQAQTIAQLRGWTPLIALQIEYSLLERTVEGDLMPMAREMGLGVTPWAPLRAGFLTGKYTRENMKTLPTDRLSTRRDNRESAFLVLDEVIRVAKEIGAEPGHVAIAWVQAQHGVSSPIIGARTLKQLEDNLKCLSITLSTQQMARLNEVSKPTLNFPAEFGIQTRTGSHGGMTIDGVAVPRNPMADPANGKVW
jgi:aryl-alcohol dehydrogenase-like predicted oxidoreductase